MFLLAILFQMTQNEYDLKLLELLSQYVQPSFYFSKLDLIFGELMWCLLERIQLVNINIRSYFGMHQEN
jgi:hypothetical protein